MEGSFGSGGVFEEFVTGLMTPQDETHREGVDHPSMKLWGFSTGQPVELVQKVPVIHGVLAAKQDRLITVIIVQELVEMVTHGIRGRSRQKGARSDTVNFFGLGVPSKSGILVVDEFDPRGELPDGFTGPGEIVYEDRPDLDPLWASVPMLNVDLLDQSSCFPIENECFVYKTHIASFRGYLRFFLP